VTDGVDVIRRIKHRHVAVRLSANECSVVGACAFTQGPADVRPAQARVEKLLKFVAQIVENEVPGVPVMAENLDRERVVRGDDHRQRLRGPADDTIARGQIAGADHVAETGGKEGD
jgi:hypothetical protein